MSARKPSPALAGAQLAAVSPSDTVWLSASAGTGKTHVLTSRVLRLLLQPDVEPSQILCLTFTKAGAAEMASRINDRLASWVRMEVGALHNELEGLGAASGPDACARARTLFASVLDCPCGGLRIDTIHAFAQWLLSAFPLEAQLPPGSRAMEDRERALLSRQVLAELLTKAERDPLGDPSLLQALSALSMRMESEKVEAFLLRCAEAEELWFGAGGWQEPMRSNVHRVLGLAEDAGVASLAAMCSDEVFDVASLQRCGDTLAAWDSATGRDGAMAISGWLSLDNAERAETIDALYLDLFTKTTGAPKQLNNILKRDPDYEGYITRVEESIAKVRDHRGLLALADRLVPALRLGRAFAIAWRDAKQREGLIDFDDQIRLAADLLTRSDYAQWIGYKLDRQFDHILVDEAQDTNAAQWQIINALTEEFFAGQGQRGDRMRTLFVVGDYKQAIFRFQGTSPENFQAALEQVRGQMQGAAENAASLRSNTHTPELREPELVRSFRTTQPVLDFVDKAIAEIGPDSFGLAKPPERHKGDDMPGYVALWQPVGSAGDSTADPEDEEGDEGGAESGTWLSRPDRQMADRIARQVKAWLDHGYPLVKKGRNAHAGDVMVLVRKRRELAGLIVARLHAAGVPVAGVDRLRLGAPLAVRDLVAALRFAAQPFDCLNLASLLVSPLMGWSQEQLLTHGYREDKVKLWDHLRRSSHPDVVSAREQLGALLALADFTLPQALLQWLLVGPWQGRRKLVARLGAEANDPINELLSAAQMFASSATPSLTGFLQWFDAGDGEIKREADNAAGQVRVMTVHGAKGLQAPIVILADAAGDPTRGLGSTLDLPDPANGKRKVPLPGLRKEERLGRIKDEYELVCKAELEEHWRLLYVAMTRAEEGLFIGGALGVKDKEPKPDSWFARLRAVFGTAEPVEMPIWGHGWEMGARVAPYATPTQPEVPAVVPPLPHWLTRVPSEEPRPPRPLAPSALGEDMSALPPEARADQRLAAKRGVLIHKLLERLPHVARVDRDVSARSWLERNGADFDESDRKSIVASALAVLDDPAWQDLFTPDALAEVSIAAPVGGQVIAGTIDRLLIAPDIIRFVDFKTGRGVPGDVSRVPIGIVRQMAAYAAALEVTYPGRRIEGALLYTAEPKLIALPPDLLAAHKPGFSAAQ